MKRLLYALLLFGAWALRAQTAQAQTRYGDMYNQWASMEYAQWSFSPDWYYYSWYDVWVDLPWPLPGYWMTVPGLGVHDNGPGDLGGGDHYVDERWRQMSPLRVRATASTVLERSPATEVKNEWDSIAEVELRHLADHQVNLAALVDRESREDVLRRIDKAMASLSGGRARPFADEYAKVRGNLDIIGSSFVPNGEKIKAYERELKRLKDIRKGSFIVSFIEGQSRIYGTGASPAGPGQGADADAGAGGQAGPDGFNSKF